MSRPYLSPEEQLYHDAWAYLRRDRPYLSHSLGMSGALLLQQKTPRSAIRAEGERLGFEGDDLDEFIEIVAGRAATLTPSPKMSSPSMTSLRRRGSGALHWSRVRAQQEKEDDAR
ncbi:MAG: hypothetical protein AB7I59_22705 [Geminicoccaceae bacterium]